MRLGIEREMHYAQEFPFVDYGKDLELMAEIEQGIKVYRITRSPIDMNPPEKVKEKMNKVLHN